MKMFNCVKCQMSTVEIALVVMIFAFGISCLRFSNVFSQQDYKFSVDSALDSIYYSEDFRDIILSEDLSSSSPTQNWDDLKSLLDDMFINYEFVLSNVTYNKALYSCSNGYEKYIAQRIIAIKDNDNYDFRVVSLGVCY